MKIRLLKYLLILGSSYLLGCGNIERLDTSKLKGEIEAHKIKKISEPDIIAFMNTRGQELIGVLAKEDCEEASHQLDSLKGQMLFELTGINPATLDSPIEKEKQVMEALQYAMEEGSVLKPTFQKLSDTSYAFYFKQVDNGCTPETDAKFWKLAFKKRDLIQSM